MLASIDRSDGRHCERDRSLYKISGLLRVLDYRSWPAKFVEMAQRKVEQLLMKLSSYNDFTRTRMTSRGLLSLAKWLKWNQGSEKGRYETRGTDHPPVQCGTEE